MTWKRKIVITFVCLIDLIQIYEMIVKYSTRNTLRNTGTKSHSGVHNTTLKNVHISATIEPIHPNLMQRTKYI